MKLLVEKYFDSKSEVLEEDIGEKKIKNHYLVGIFMQTETLNRNNRIYPRGIVESELGRYKSLIENKRALGELSHPNTPSINLDKVSHVITDLHFERNDVVGRAKILETPNGRIVKNLINDGIMLGMSSRGLGSVKAIRGADQVQEDFKLAAIDIVAEPSAPDAWVAGLMENKEWVFVNGIFEEKEIEQAQRAIKGVSREHIEATSALIFENFLKRISI